MKNRIIAVVPARSGSKGFPNKNIAKVGDVSLLEMAISCGLHCNSIDHVYVSTDSEHYEKIALAHGAKSLGLRDPSLSGDDASTVDVLLDMLQDAALSNVTHVVLLQPTSPIRTTDLVEQAIHRCLLTSNSVVSVAKVEDPHPFKMKVIREGAIHSFLQCSSSEVPRQRLPEVYQLTGSVYVSTAINIMENKSLFSRHTEPVFQDEFINIDSERDFKYFQYLMAGQLG